MGSWDFETSKVLVWFGIWIALIVLLILTGCTVVQKVDRYADMERGFLDPRKVEAHYERDGEEVSGWEQRCFGEGCQLPSERR